MKQGIVYCMTCIVPGLVKIGESEIKNFEERMRDIEHDGYNNVTGFKRYFAIKVDDHKKREAAIHNLYKNVRVGKSELFAIDKDEVVKMFLEVAGGEQFYPDPAVESTQNIKNEIQEKQNTKTIPNGIYTLEEKEIKATIKIDDGTITLLKGSCIKQTPSNSFLTGKNQNAPKNWIAINSNIVKDGKLTEDTTICESVSNAASVVLAASKNGWILWKNKNGEPIDIYRNKN